MAKTDAERARDYRARQREKRGIVQVMPVSAHEAFKAKARTVLEEQRAEISALRAQLALREQISALSGQLAGLEEQMSGDRPQQGPDCPACGGDLACPQCSRGGSWEDDFG